MNSINHILQPLYSADNVKLIETKAAEIEGYELFELMKRAGKSAYETLVEHYPEANKIVVVAGAGNNAGDGFILALHALEAGKDICVLTVNNQPSYQGDAATAFNLIQESELSIAPFSEQALLGCDVVVDAILGTGIRGPLRENYLAVIETINSWRIQTSGRIFALDIPSGLQADDGTINPTAIKADNCLSFIALKSGMVTAMAREYCSNWQVDNLNITEQARKNIPITAFVDDSQSLIHSLPKRARTSHKGSHGHLLLIGGDDGFGGAILMAAQAAARVGAGRFTIITRDNHVAPFLTQFPEAMIRSIEDPEHPDFTSLLFAADAVVIGPGLGRADWGARLLQATLSAECPLVIDADGLYHLTEHEVTKDSWVLTPHPGEASRMLHKSVPEIEANRYAAVKQLQQQYHGVMVLKGAGTLIANESFISVCTDGNPGMATAGMGDILSGIVGSLLAQGISTHKAARIAVALHAKAADLAANDGEKGLLATDLLTPLRYLVNQQ